MSPRITKASVLVVRPGALGDTVLGLPVLESIRLRHPDRKIVVLGNGTYSALIPPEVEFHAVDDPRWLCLFNGAEGKPPPGPFSDAYLILNRPDDVVRNLIRWGTPRIHHARSSPAAGKHVVECIQEGLGLEPLERKPALLRLAPESREGMVWVHPGSGSPRKCLPLELILCFAERIAQTRGWRLCVTIGEADGFLKSDPAWKEILERPDTGILAARPIDEICSRMGRASLFVGNDSGMSHLAAALAVPSIVFFIATDPLQWAPWVPSDLLTVADLRGLADAPSKLESALGRVEPPPAGL